jgi:hypothetical protein
MSEEDKKTVGAEEEDKQEDEGQDEPVKEEESTAHFEPVVSHRKCILQRYCGSEREEL